MLLATISDTSNCLGQIAAHKTFLESQMQITAKIPIPAIEILLRCISFFDGGMNVCFVFAAALVLRSNMMAIKTTARPATNPSPTFLMVRALTIGPPRPGEAINAAITTKESAAITVWFIPSTIICLPIGN